MQRWLCSVCRLFRSENRHNPTEPATPQVAPATTPHIAASNSIVPSKLDPPLHDWKTPAAALLLTGEQHGYFEPCGCALHQLGGMARRGDLFRILSEERKWPVAGLDVGGSLRRNRRQDQIRFDILMSAFKHMNYAGLGFGVEELRLGADFLLQKQAESEMLVPLISANVKLFDSLIPGWPVPYPDREYR